MVVVSKLGAGRAGSFCAMSVAYGMLGQGDAAVGWDRDVNILDQVIRALRQQRNGLVQNQRQFEFCHRVLDEAMWGHLEQEQAAARKGKKERKFFGRKKTKGTFF